MELRARSCGREMCSTRLLRSTTIGGAATASRYSYSHQHGRRRSVHTAGLSASVRLSRWGEFSAFAGASRVRAVSSRPCPSIPRFWLSFARRVSSRLVRLPLEPWFPTMSSGGRLWPAVLPVFPAWCGIPRRRRIHYPRKRSVPDWGATASAGYGYSGLRKWSLNIGATTLAPYRLETSRGATATLPVLMAYQPADCGAAEPGILIQRHEISQQLFQRL